MAPPPLDMAPLLLGNPGSATVDTRSGSVILHKLVIGILPWGATAVANTCECKYEQSYICHDLPIWYFV